MALRAEMSTNTLKRTLGASSTFAHCKTIVCYAQLSALATLVALAHAVTTMGHLTVARKEAQGLPVWA
jgi:hypothetical protein